MEERNDDLRSYQESFQNMKGHIHILERSVSVELQMEYFRSSKNYKKSLPSKFTATDEQCEAWYAQILEQSETMFDFQVKDLLLKLASSKNPRAYTLLKQYVQQEPEPRELDWAYLALMDCEISLESELSDERQIYIATGLGGKGEKLRFYVLIPSTDLHAFEAYQRQVVEREFNYYFPKVDCEIDNLFIGLNYVELLILIPIRSDIRQVMARIIEDCNEYGNFLADVYTITNVKTFTRREIEEVLEHYAGREDY